MVKPQWSMVFVILLTAAAAFFIGRWQGMELPAFLYIVIAVFGFLIHTIILILRSDNESEAQDTQVKGKAK